MQVTVLASILLMLCIHAQGAEKIVTIQLSNVTHRVSVPLGWTAAQGKIEWRSGPKGEELLSLYAVPEKSLSNAVAGTSARFERMFSPRNIKRTAPEIELRGTNEWRCAFTSTNPEPKPDRVLYYQRYLESAGRIFYLQYRRALQRGEDSAAGLNEAKRLTGLWEIK